MRDDGLWLDYNEVVWFAAALDEMARYAARAGSVLPPSVITVRAELHAFLSSRASGRGDATTRPLVELMADPDEVDARNAAERLGLTPDAIRKACRAGRFKEVARKRRGRWMIPAEDVEVGA